MADSTDLSPAILKQLSQNYNITVTPKRKDDKQEKRKVGNACKLAVREVYKAIQKVDNSFGFQFGKDKGYKDPVNEAVTTRLVNAVIVSEGGVEKCPWPLRELEGASKIYYISLRDSARRKESGKDKDHADRSRRQSRRRERAGRLKQSLKTAKDDKLEGLDKKKLASVLSPEYMSSEESDVDSEGVFVSFKVRRLPWQTEAFKKVKDNLEEAHKSKLSPQHLRQVKKRRVVELPSMRPAPQGCPGFILREEEER